MFGGRITEAADNRGHPSFSENRVGHSADIAGLFREAGDGVGKFLGDDGRRVVSAF